MWLVTIVQGSAALDQTPYFKGKVIFIFFKQQNKAQNSSSPISSSVSCLLNQVPFLLFPVVNFQFLTFIFTEDPPRLSNHLLYPLKLPNFYERSQSLQNRKILTYEVKVTQSCPNLCNHKECSLAGSSVHGILQARILARKIYYKLITKSKCKDVGLPEKKVKVTQSSPILCDPIEYTVHGILQARILEWVAVPFSRGSFQPRDRNQVSCIASGFFTS